MIRRTKSIYLIFFLSILLALSGCGGGSGGSGGGGGNDDNGSGTGGDFIIDHTCTDLTKIPTEAINNAKEKLVIAYGHTSHGSQLTNGMSGLVTWERGGSLYSWNSNGAGGALRLRDFNGNFGGYGIANDLGAPNRTAWADATRTYLKDHPETNVIIWSWCGQANGTSEEINTYLNLMSQLERDFPGVDFVYMTGHLNGTGIEGNLHQRNEQIRNYCRINKKILYDFADIETWGPSPSSNNPGDSTVYYGDKFPTDGCCYDFNNSGSTTYRDEKIPTDGDRNWASDWQNAHTEGTHWYNCSSAHSVALNANRKAFAAWWLWARLAGWDGE